MRVKIKVTRLAATGMAAALIPFGLIATAGAAGASTTTIGVTSISGATGVQSGADYHFGNEYTPTYTGTLTSVEEYVAGHGTAQTVAPVVYAVSGTTPGALIASGATETITPSQAPGWVSESISAPVTAGTPILLGMLTGASSSGASEYANTSSGTNHYAVNAAGNTSPDSTWGTDATDTHQFVENATETYASNTPPVFTADTPTSPAYVGTPYSYKDAAAGATSYAISANSPTALPHGMTLNASTGVISGTPTRTDIQTFRITATNSTGSTESPNQVIYIDAAQTGPTFAADTPPSPAYVGTPYSYKDAATGATSYAVSANSPTPLPHGVTLNATTGVISGTPTTTGILTFRITATDAAGSTESPNQVIYVDTGQQSTAGAGTPDACPSGSTAVTTTTVPSNFAADTNYCFAAGTYSGFSKTIPTGDGWYGQGGAVLDGGNSQLHAIYSQVNAASNLVIDGFTIRDYSLDCTSATYNCGGDYSVSITYGTNINVTNNTFGSDYQGGYKGDGGVTLGGGEPTCQYPANIASLPIGASCYNYITDSNISHNTFTDLMWGGPTIGGGYDNTVNYNYVSDTDAGSPSGDGMNSEYAIAAIGKFAVDSDTTVEHNYVTGNYENGIWFDVFDTDETVADNTFVGSASQQSAQSGVMIEISCNAVIENNNFSNVGYSDANTGNWGAGVRISSSGSSTESGGAPYYSPCGSFNTSGAMPGYQGIEVLGNTFTNDLDAVALYDGHEMPSGDPVYDTDITVSGNTMNGTTESAYNQSGASYTGPNESDALVAEAASAEANVSWSNNNYNLVKASSFGAGTWAQWKAAGFDTSGSTCTLNGSAC